MLLLIAFAAAPLAHWKPRFEAGGINVEGAPPPTVDNDNQVHGLPPEQEGVFILVNARVASASAGKRKDLLCLPQGFPQIVDIDNPNYPVAIADLISV